MPSISVKQKKRGRPATGKTPITGVRLSDDLSEGIDRYIADQPQPPPTKSDALREIIRDWLIGHGYLDSSKD